MTIIEDTDPLVSPDDEYVTIKKSELDLIREIAETASSNKVFYIRMFDHDLDSVRANQTVISVVEEELRNYIIVLANHASPIPDNEYFQQLMIDNGKVIVEK